MTQPVDPNHIRIPGRARTQLPAPDAPTLCSLDIHAELFARVIDLSYNARQDPKRGHDNLAAHIAEAKAVCAGCPVRLQCLELHGRDYEIGVVGGMTDAERRKAFKAAS